MNKNIALVMMSGVIVAVAAHFIIKRLDRDDRNNREFYPRNYKRRVRVR